MQRRRSIVRALLSAGILASAACHTSTRLPEELVGTWTGSGRVIVTWVERERIDLELVVRDDGGVRGRVGDATLTQARLRRNRGWLGRTLGVQTDWIVEGALTGPLIEAEDLHREGVKLPLDLERGRLVGGLHSSGWKVGGPERGVVSASDVELERR